MVEPGQLRRWIPDDAKDPGEVFMILQIIRPNPLDKNEVYVEFLNGVSAEWDELIWIEEWSEVISEGG